MNYRFQWARVFRSLPDLLWGAVSTLEIATISMIFAIAFAIALALLAASRNILARTVTRTWVELARNTPALFQIYMIYFGLGSFGFKVDSAPALVAGITFNSAGYLAESFRAGLRTVPETQIRAARCLGLSAIQVFIYVTLPQLLRIVFFPITNQFVWAILMTSLGVVVGLTTDLMGVTQQLNVITFRTFEYFFVAAVLYYLIAKAVTLLARLLASRLFQY